MRFTFCALVLSSMSFLACGGDAAPPAVPSVSAPEVTAPATPTATAAPYGADAGAIPKKP